MNIQDRVFAVISKYYKGDAKDIKLEADLQKDLKLDSLDIVETTMAFEEEFGIEIPDEKAAQIKTVAHLCKHIEEETK